MIEIEMHIKLEWKHKHTARKKNMQQISQTSQEPKNTTQ